MEHIRPKLIILPGWGHGRAVWDAFLDRFPEGEAEVIELPGFGETPLVSQEWGVPEYVGWVMEAITKRGHTNVILLGHSFGGRVAAAVASEQPSWLTGVILYAAPLLYRPSALVRLKVLLAKIGKSLVPKQMRALFGATPDSTHAASLGMHEVFKRVIPYDLSKKLPSIKIPTLLIWGAHDTYPTLRIAKEAQKLIPGSVLEVIKDAGHTAHIEKADLFYGHVTRFLNAQ